MYKGCRNIIVFAEANSRHNQTDIYLSISGNRYYVISQRFASPILRLLATGVPIEELNRWNGRGSFRNVPSGYISKGKLAHTLKYLLPVIDSVLLEEELIEGGVAYA